MLFRSLGNAAVFACLGAAQFPGAVALHATLGASDQSVLANRRMKSVFQKTSVRRQAELMLMLAHGSAKSETQHSGR